MKLELTCSNGENYIFKNFGKTGDYITVKFTTKTGKELIYMIRVTNSDKLIMS